MWQEWLASERTIPSVWEEFEPVLAIPGFRFETHNGGRFAEGLVAWQFYQEGYECFRACALFPPGKALGVLQEPTDFLRRA